MTWKWNGNDFFMLMEKGGTGDYRNMIIRLPEQTLYLDIGNTFYIRDADAAYATRLSLVSNTGHLSTFGYVYPGTGAAMQATRYISDDGTYTKVSHALMIGGSEIYGNSYIGISSQANQGMALRCGSIFRFQDVDAANADRMTLNSATGVLAVDGSASATYADDDHPVGLFDDWDDALVLRRGIQQRELGLLYDMGVFTPKEEESGYFINVQPMFYLVAGGVYQNRAKIDNLNERLEELERKDRAIPERT